MKYVLIIMLSAILIGCTDATRASITSYGSNHKVTMYNGGVKVREWISTGRVNSIQNSDGWEFMCKETGELVRVGGDVIIEEI